MVLNTGDENRPSELDKTGIPQFGLVAEEVAKVNPDLVTHDAKDDICTVRYEAVNTVLLNEFLKEHRRVEKLEATVADLAETVNEQAAQLQRVSAQVQMNSSVGHISNPKTAQTNAIAGMPDAGVWLYIF